MFGRLVDMATRTLIIDLSKGTGGEPMYGMVTVQRTRATSEGTFEVLPWETKLKLFNGIATITEAVTDGSGPFYRSAYLIRVQNGYCAPRWGFMAALPDGTTPISTGDMPKVNPITGEGIYMDAQEWNALYGTLPSRVSGLEVRVESLEALGGLSPESPIDGQTANLIEQDGTLTAAAVDERIRSHTGNPTIISVKDFGAMGDGVTDDSVAIQAAIDDTSARKATLKFPSGSYMLNGESQLTLRSNTHIIGEPGTEINMSNRTGWNSGSAPEGFIIKGQGALGAEILVTQDTATTSDIVHLTSTAGLSNGDLLLLTSDSTWPGDVSPAKAGELIKILKVEDSTRLTLATKPHEEYRLTDRARIYKVDPVKNVVIKGITFTGRGVPPGGATKGQLGVGIFWGENITLDNCDFKGLDQICMELCGVYGYRVNNTRFDSGKVPEGWTYPYVQYQMRISSPSTYGVVDGAYGVSGRHTVFTGHYATFPGIVRHLIVKNCFALGTWHAAFSTHNDTEHVVFDNNTAVNCVYGFNMRDKNATVTNNTMVGCHVPILYYGRTRGVTVSGNKIYKTTGTAIYMQDNQMDADTDFNDLTIENNEIDGSVVGIYLQNNSNNRLKRGLSISGNKIRNIGDGTSLNNNAVRINGAFSGRIQNNDIRHINGGHAIHLEGLARYLQVRGNMLEGFATGVHILSTITYTTVRDNTFAHYTGVPIRIGSGVGVDAVIANNIDYGTAALS